MRNIKIKLDNFRAIDYKEIKFNNNINCISATNGKGKTSILYALKLALFNQADFNLEDYINWNTNKDYFNIELSFTYNNKNYKIIYNYDKKTKTTRELYIDDDLYKNTDAVNKLKEIFNPDICLIANIINQGEDGIVGIKPAQRRDFFKSLYDLEFKKEIEVLKYDLNNVDLELSNIEKSLYLYSNKVYNYKSLLAIPFSDDDIRNKKEELNNLVKEIANIESLFLEINNKKEKLQKNEQRIFELQSLINRNKKNIEDYQYNISDLNEDINKTHFISNEIEDLKNKQKDINDKINKIVLQRLPVFDDSIIKLLEKQVNELDYNILHKEKELSFFEKGKCPTCNREFNIADFSSIKEEIKKLYKLKEEADNKLKEEFLKKKDYEDLKEKNENEKNKKQQLELELKDIENKIYIKQQSLHNKKTVNELKIQDLKNRIENEKEKIDIYTNELNILIQDNLQIKNFLNTNTIDDLLLKSKKDKIYILEKDINFYNDVISKNEQITKYNEELSIQEKEDKQEMSKFLELKNNFLHKKEILLATKQIIEKSLPNFIITKILKNIEDEMNNFINKIYDKNLNVSITEKKDSIYINYGKKEKDISLASGYEKQIINIAFKIALQKLVDLDLLLLDEPDSNASIENSFKLYNNIFSHKDLFGVIILITHKEEIKDLIYGIENSNIVEII